jgi:predicted dehydrogenase
MYTHALTQTFREHADLVAICDTNQGRMDLFNRRQGELGMPATATYDAGRFDDMVREARPDTVIVTTGPDVTHSDYICRAMELGCDVVTEKPMTTDEVRCRDILRVIERTGKRLQVTFNYRYSPPRSQVKEMLDRGDIGDILSVDFTWLLDTRHGADYFRRWHRRLGDSGSLLVHKATHHFDLVNWWLSDAPEEVFCHATKRYYTAENADRMGLSGRGTRCLDCSARSRCRFALDLAASKDLRELYLDNERYDGYARDRCVFSPEIDIWDTMSVSVRYRRGALLNYHLHAYSPYEGYHIAFNGTKGRLEHQACENTYISGDGTVPGELARGNTTITYIPEFSSPQAVEVRMGAGGHGGGDPVLLADLFHPEPPPDALGRRATERDGAYSILVGVAAYRSALASRPIRIADLLDGAPIGD